MNKRYPRERIIYSKDVGHARVMILVSIFKELGFDPITSFIEASGPDIWVFKDNILVLVCEVLNWKRESYMDAIRARSIVKNLSKHDCLRLIICSFQENYINRINWFTGLRIDFIVLGFQTQPLSYYDFFQGLDRAQDMRPSSDETYNVVKEEVERYLKIKKLL